MTEWQRVKVHSIRTWKMKQLKRIHSSSHSLSYIHLYLSCYNMPKCLFGKIMSMCFSRFRFGQCSCWVMDFDWNVRINKHNEFCVSVSTHNVQHQRTSCLSDDVGMRMASDSTLYIPAMMWLSLFCGMTLLSAMDFITSLESFPSRALTTAGQWIVHRHMSLTYLKASPALTW